MLPCTHSSQLTLGLNVPVVFAHNRIFHDQEGLLLEAVSWCSAGKSRKDRSLVLQPRDLAETVPTVQQTLSGTLACFSAALHAVSKTRQC